MSTILSTAPQLFYPVPFAYSASANQPLPSFSFASLPAQASQELPLCQEQPKATVCLSLFQQQSGPLSAASLPHYV
jgi:hypothetical protein